MGLRPTFSMNGLRQDFAAAKQQRRQVAINLLIYLGEQCVIQARTNGSYQDQTGNLRASVGYVVVADGRVVSSSFGQGPGEAEGERAVVERAQTYPSGLVLIVVAGMNYAAKVESQGKDVLTSSELYAKANLPRLLRELIRT